MKKYINLYISKESQLKTSVTDKKVNYIFFFVTIIWVVLGTQFYNTNDLFEKSIYTKIVFLVFTLLIIWKNADIIKPYFRIPFGKVGGRHSISNVLWVYPFTVLLSTIAFLIIPLILGLYNTDAQGLNNATLSMDEYFSSMLTLPLLVFEEESLNTVLLLVLAKVLAKRFKNSYLILAVLITSMFFGAIHVSAWGWQAAIQRMLIHIPFIFSIVYLRSAWISMLAHFYQNALTYTSMIIEDFSTTFVTYGFLLLIVIISYRKLVYEKFINKEKNDLCK